MQRLLLLFISSFIFAHACAQDVNSGLSKLPALPAINEVADSTLIRKEMKEATRLALNYPDSALAIYRRTLRQSFDAQFVHGIIASLGSIGNIHIGQGLFEEARQNFADAIPYCFNSVYGRNNLSSLYNGLSLTYSAVGDYENAVKFYYHTLVLAETIPTSVFKPALAYNNLSIVLIKLGQYDKALEYLDKQEKIALAGKDDSTLGYIYANKSTLYSRMKNPEQCLKYGMLVLGNDKIRSATSRNVAMTSLGYYYMSKNEPAKALPYLLKVAERADDLNVSERSVNNLSLGDVYYDLGNYKLAEKHLLQALAAANAANLRPELMLILGKLSRLYQKTGNYKLAIEYSDTAYAIRDSVENVAKSTAIAQLEIKYQTAEKDKDIIAQQLRIGSQERVIRNRNIWILGVSLGAVLITGILGLVYGLYRDNRNKQKLQEQKLLAMQQEQEIVHLKSIMEGEERERTRLARDLHDGIGGMLTSLNMNLSSAKDSCTDPVQYKKLDNIWQMLQETATEVRKTAHNLMPEVLNRYGLKDALLVYCEYINTNGGLRIDLQCHGDLSRLSKATELLVYRFTQELVQNIVKHSNATQGDVQIMMNENKLMVNVEDNGDGFDVDEVNGGYGLQNLKFRVQALHGYISVTSVPGSNSTVYIEFDLEHLQNSITA